MLCVCVIPLSLLCSVCVCVIPLSLCFTLLFVCVWYTAITTLLCSLCVCDTAITTLLCSVCVWYRYHCFALCVSHVQMFVSPASDYKSVREKLAVEKRNSQRALSALLSKTRPSHPVAGTTDPLKRYTGVYMCVCVWGGGGGFNAGSQ